MEIKKTVGQKMIIILIVISFISIIICIVEISSLKLKIESTELYISSIEYSGKEGWQSLDDAKENLSDYRLSNTLSIIGIVVSGVLIITCLILLPSVNRNAKLKYAKQEDSLEPKPSLSDLEQLKSLLDKEIITEDEYAQKKKQILGI